MNRHRQLVSLWLAAAGILLVAARAAAAPSLQLTVDRTTASVEDTLTLQVTLQGGGGASPPKLLRTEGFEVRFVGTSSQIQIVNGSFSSAKTFQYLLTPERPGHFTLGPAEVELEGQPVRSGTVDVEIVAAGSGGSAAPGVPGPSAAPRPASDERGAFVSVEASQTKPYVNQQVVYAFRFFNRVPVSNAQLKPPDFAGLWKESLGELQSGERVIEGERWQVHELKWALFPTTAGTTTIGAASLTADVLVPSRRRSRFDDPFFGALFQDTEPKVFRSAPVTLEVQPLPETGRPADFSGLVGHFTLAAQLSSTALEVGESAILTITVAGAGNLRDVPAPPLAASPDFKSYEDQPELKLNPTPEGVRGAKLFKKALVPLRAGTLTLPPFTLSFFDPKKHAYVTVATEPIPLAVKPSSRPETAIPTSGGAKQAVTLLGNDLLPLEREPGALRNERLTPRESLLWLGIALTPAAGFVGAWLWRRRRERIRLDSGYRRRSGAGKRAQARLKKLPQLGGAAFYEEASGLLRDFAGDRGNFDGRALTALDAGRRLEPRGVSPATCEALKGFLQECDAGIYGGHALNAAEKQNLLSRLAALLQRLGEETRP